MMDEEKDTMVDIEPAVIAIGLVLTAIIACYGVGILVLFRRVNKDLLKAKMFLKPEFMTRTYAYSISTGGFFVIHEAIRGLREFAGVEIRWLCLIFETLFIISFLLLTRNWYIITKESMTKEEP